IGVGLVIAGIGVSSLILSTGSIREPSPGPAASGKDADKLRNEEDDGRAKAPVVENQGGGLEKKDHTVVLKPKSTGSAIPPETKPTTIKPSDNSLAVVTPLVSKLLSIGQQEMGPRTLEKLRLGDKYSDIKDRIKNATGTNDNRN